MKNINNPFEETKQKEVGIEDIKIPECCREGSDDCRHSAQKERPVKGNIGM